MASTYSSLKLQLMATGENLSTWGSITNVNLGTALEEAITGSADVTFASNNVTLTLTDTNNSQTARNLRLNLIGTTGGSARNLVVPTFEKLYIINNTCGDAVTVKTAAGTGIAVPAGKYMWVYVDGTNVLEGVNAFTSMYASGDAVVMGNVGIGTSSPATKVEVVQNQNAATVVRVANSDPSVANRSLFQAHNGGAIVNVGMCGGAFTGAGLLQPNSGFIECSGNYLAVYTSGPAPLILGTNNTEKGRFDSTGNFAVGRTPNAWGSGYKALSVGLSASLYAGTGSPGFGLAANSYYDGATTRYIANGYDGIYNFDANSGDHAWYCAGFNSAGTSFTPTERMRLKNAGNLIVGSSSPLGSALLSVYGNVASTGEYSGASYVSAPAGSAYFEARSVGVSTFYQTNQISSNGGSWLDIICQTNGVRLLAGDNHWTTISERAKKKNIQPIPGDPFEIITAHEVGLGQYLEEADDAKLRPFLFYEDAVQAYPWATATVAAHDRKNEESGFVQHFPEFKGLSLEQYVPLLMAAFQKQIDLNDKLVARIEALEAR